MGWSYMSGLIVLWTIALAAQLAFVQRQVSLTVLLLGLVITVYRSGKPRIEIGEELGDEYTSRGDANDGAKKIVGAAAPVEGSIKAKVADKKQREAPTDAMERLLFPLAMLSEKAHLTPVVTAHSPLLSYGSCLLAYLSVQPYKGAKKDGPVLLAYILAACGVLFFITRSYYFVGAILAHACIGLLVEKPLSKYIPSGEAHLVGQFVGMVISGMVQNEPLEGSLTVDGTTQSTTPSMHVASNAALLTGWLTAGIMFALNRYTSVLSSTHGQATNGSRTAVYTAVVAVSLGVAYMFVWAKFGFQVSPLLWAYHTIILHVTHFLILVMWTVVLSFSLTLIGIMLTFPEVNIPLIIRRKIFHILAVALFLPPVMIGQTHYLSLGISAAVGIMLLVESARLSQTWWTRPLNAVLSPVVDSKDGSIVRTHLYLLWGCGMSFFLDSREIYSYYKEQPSTNATTNVVSGYFCHARMLAILLVPGIVQLGVGDAIAATIGTMFGTTKWAPLLCGDKKKKAGGGFLSSSLLSCFPKEANEPLTRKSLEGTAAALVAVLVKWLIISCILGGNMPLPSEEPLARWWWHGGIFDPVVLVGLVFGVVAELCTPATDNLVVPLYTFGVMHLTAAWV